MTYVVHGATGAQGGPVLNALKANNKAAVGIGRSIGTSSDGSMIVADLDSSSALANAYRSASGVFVHLPVADPACQLAWAKNIADALAKVRPARVVISTSGEIVDRPGSPLQRPDDSGLPVLIRSIQEAGLSYAVVAPRLFQENLLAPHVFDSIAHEAVLRYPLRSTLPVSWSSHIDVAEVVSALFDRADISGVVAVGQQPPLTGHELADAFSAYLNRKVAYEAISPEAFGAGLAPLLGEAAAAGVATIYKSFSNLDHHSFDVSCSAQAVLGIAPLTVEEWLKRVLGLKETSEKTRQ